MTIAQPANRLLLGFFLSSFVLLTACGVGNRPSRADNTPVETSDLFAIGSRLYDTPNETRPNQERTDLVHKFLNVNDNRISTAGVTSFNIPPTVCTFDGCVPQAQAGPTGNGYAYYIGNDARGNATNSYAGILASTNLGEPLRVFNAPLAYWQGEWSLNGVAGDVNDPSDDFWLEVDYLDRNINGPTSRGNPSGRAGAVAGVKIIDGVRHELIVNGTSDNPIRYNEAGVIMSGQALLRRSNIVYSGFLIGLIGEEGAVGAFRSSDSDVSFAGGFTVSPPKRNP